MTFILYAGGPINQVPPLTEIVDKYPDAKFVGVDSGTLVLLKNGISPVHAIGDFDSLSHKELEWIRELPVELNVFPQRKDETDMELALKWTLSQNPSEIIILGASGGRLDHLFINAQLLLKGFEQKVPVFLLDRWNKVRILQEGVHSIIKESYPYLSLIPLSEQVDGLTLKGFKYPLQNQKLVQGSSLCVSNELIMQKGTVSFKRGKLYLIQSRD